MGIQRLFRNLGSQEKEVVLSTSIKLAGGIARDHRPFVLSGQYRKKIVRVNQATVEKIWQRFTLESHPPFPLKMENAEFTAIDLWGGPGQGYVLRSDGIIAKWDWDIEYEVELEEGWCIGSLVIASERMPELKEALPTRPEKAVNCENCNGQGFTDLPNAPRFLLCQTCWGLGWI